MLTLFQAVCIFCGMVVKPDFVFVYFFDGRSERPNHINILHTR